MERDRARISIEVVHVSTAALWTTVQVITCGQPQQLLQITLNHLEVVKKMTSFAGLLSLIDKVIEVCICRH